MEAEFVYEGHGLQFHLWVARKFFFFDLVRFGEVDLVARDFCRIFGGFSIVWWYFGFDGF